MEKEKKKRDCFSDRVFLLTACKKGKSFSSKPKRFAKREGGMITLGFSFCWVGWGDDNPSFLEMLQMRIRIKLKKLKNLNLLEE